MELQIEFKENDIVIYRNKFYTILEDLGKELIIKPMGFNGKINTVCYSKVKPMILWNIDSEEPVLDFLIPIKK